MPRVATESDRPTDRSCPPARASQRPTHALYGPLEGREARHSLRLPSLSHRAPGRCRGSRRFLSRLPALGSRNIPQRSSLSLPAQAPHLPAFPHPGHLTPGTSRRERSTTVPLSRSRPRLRRKHPAILATRETLSSLTSRTPPTCFLSMHAGTFVTAALRFAPVALLLAVPAAGSARSAHGKVPACMSLWIGCSGQHCLVPYYVIRCGYDEANHSGTVGVRCAGAGVG